jgi:O-antigen ligase
VSTRVEAAPWAPGLRWWAILALAMAAGVIVNWILAIGVLVLLLAQVARPFDFVGAFLVLVAGAAFVDNVGGGLTYQLAMLSCAILVMMVCYAISSRGRVFCLPKTALTWPLGLYVLLSLANAARGFLAGYSRRFWGLELIALLAVGTTFLVANAFDRRRDLRIAILGLIMIGFAAAGRGFWDFTFVKTHAKATYMLGVPGIVGLLLVNLALRSRTGVLALGWILLSLPMFFEQFITYGRGLWTGCAAGLALSIAVFVGRGPGVSQRWRRAGLVLATFAGVGIVGTLHVVVVLGRTDVLQEAGTRFSSITSTEDKLEAHSNLIRLGEYLTVANLIRQSPWVGYGVGYTFLHRQSFTTQAREQWGVHQNYLMVWLKQGLVGLVLFVWILWAAMKLGVREARRRTDPWESTWFASMAAGTAFLATLSLSNNPFATVNETFLVALFWGGAMAMTRRGLIHFQWSRLRGGESGGEVTGEPR